MKNAKSFLEMCRQRFPSTRLHQAHSLTLREDTLVLTLMLGDTAQQFNLTEADLERNPADLLADVAKLYKRPARSPKAPKPDGVA
jgi:hypothetical protein